MGINPALLNMLGLDPSQAAEVQRWLTPENLDFWRREIQDANTRSKVLVAKANRTQEALSAAQQERIQIASELAAIRRELVAIRQFLTTAGSGADAGAGATEPSDGR